jgi:hypothetical protein
MNEYEYTIPLDKYGVPSQVVILRSDNVWIPNDPTNSDYKAYLAWVAEGNEAIVEEQDN